MLYLEDYIEMIEHLPQELKDRFTEIRELDLQVQNATDKLEEKVKEFFGGARKLRPVDREEVYETVRKEYCKVLEDADEKVHQANQMYDLVERYIRRLDQDLYKFKMELEADNAGITEILEKRSLELDQPGNKDSKDKDLNSAQTQKENRLLPVTPLSGIKVEKRGRKRLGNGKIKGGESGTSTPTTSYASDHLDIAANSLVAALAQTISSQKNKAFNGQNYDVFGDADPIGMSLDMTDAAELKRRKTEGQGKLTANGGEEVGANGVKRNKRKSQHVKTGKFSDESEMDKNGTDMENGDTPEIWPYDPTEPRYCLCNQVSYGNMVACDNENCPIEWYHYPCVGIVQSPKGKWYCPTCITTVKRRGRKTLTPQT
ncbi:Inhibitor of growth protein 3 [Orchesella cincta]|uniref:Inhibitor of growth protein n=1 Tax=Orchesella cincta TaxID=48709 RepID=A0A1D2NH52_ORCCI|nr:Inhibitor of growth protein 3 [Orchesella cincta]